VLRALPAFANEYRGLAPLNLPAAHAGHVIVDLLTVAPVFLLILWFAFITIRDRRAGVDDEKGDPPRT
jgi:hypothetical protein